MQTFTELSKQSAKHLKEGMLRHYVRDMKQMSDILSEEGLRTDELKFLMIAFCFEMNCFAEIDSALVEKTRDAVVASGMTENELEQLYLDTVRPDTTPRRIMETWDSLYVLKLCIDGRENEAREIVSKSDREMQNLPNAAKKI
jgi:hypothetical protein